MGKGAFLSLVNFTVQYAKVYSFILAPGHLLAIVKNEPSKAKNIPFDKCTNRD